MIIALMISYLFALVTTLLLYSVLSEKKWYEVQEAHPEVECVPLYCVLILNQHTVSELLIYSHKVT